MFGHGSKKSAPKNKSGLKLATDDRTRIRVTKNSDQLAREMLEIAREKAKDLPIGAEVTVDVPREHLEVHHLELMFSFMTLASEYGLEAGVQFNNSQTFQKI